MNRTSSYVCTVGFGLATLLASGGCSGPPVPSPIQGEPVCPDFEVGAVRSTRMRGGLRFPITVTLRQGKSVVSHAVLEGLRANDARPTLVSLPNGNESYIVEWAQCENEQAPRPVVGDHTRKGAPEARAATPYECGKPVPYKTDQLITKKGDLATHALTLPPPPMPGCWTGDAPRPGTAPATAPGSAGAIAAPPSASAGAALTKPAN